MTTTTTTTTTTTAKKMKTVFGGEYAHMTVSEFVERLAALEKSAKADSTSANAMRREIARLWAQSPAVAFKATGLATCAYDRPARSLWTALADVVRLGKVEFPKADLWAELFGSNQTLLTKNFVMKDWDKVQCLRFVEYIAVLHVHGVNPRKKIADIKGYASDGGRLVGVEYIPPKNLPPSVKPKTKLDLSSLKG